VALDLASSDPDFSDKISEVPQYDIEIIIPLTAVSTVKTGPGLVLTDEAIRLEEVIRIVCATGQMYKFGFQTATNYRADSIKTEIKKLMAPQYFARLFAFCYRNALVPSLDPELLETSTSPNFYFLEKEAERMDIMRYHLWRITELCESLCTTYPQKIIVPSCVSDIDLIRAASFHRNHRLPAACWQHTSGAIMLRAAGTTSRRGKAGTRCEADEAYLHAVCVLNSSVLQDAKLWVFTDRPLTNSSKTSTGGRLSREQAKSYYYPECKFVYSEWDSEIETYKAVRASFNQLQLLMHSNMLVFVNKPKS
jgi:hypothetical protein